VRSPRSLTAAVGLALAGASALAAPADPAAGAAKAKACPACHGAQGVASLPLTPSLAGQPALALSYQLIQFREKRRLAPAMNPIAEPLSDQDIKDIAAHYASLPPPPGIAQTDTAKLDAGRQVAQVQHCNSCHNGKLQGQKHIPRLAGQPVDYLRTQMLKLRSGERADIDGSMASAAQVLSDADIEAVSIYAASLAP
jgi:cytochrome c553